MPLDEVAPLVETIAVPVVVGSLMAAAVVEVLDATPSTVALVVAASVVVVVAPLSVVNVTETVLDVALGQFPSAWKFLYAIAPQATPS